MAQRLMEAAIKNETTDLEEKLASLSEEDGVLWLHKACEVNSINFVCEVIRRKPDLVWCKNQDGQSLIHVACEYERGEIVKALVESIPDLCFLRDGRLLIPLHIATMRGDTEVMKILVKACPQSLAEVTSLDETAFHLAAKHKQIDAFDVLLKETLNRKLEKILHNKDYEGNTVFHLAIAHKLIQILQWLLVENPKHGPLVRINSRNGRGFTALDLHFHNFIELNDKAINSLLRQAGARRGQSPSHSQSVPNSRMHYKNKCFSKSSVLLTASILIAGSTYTSIFNLNHTYAGMRMLRARDIILHSDQLPDVFFSIMFMTIAFTASMIGVVVPVLSMIKEWSFCSRAVPLLALGSFFLSYAFIMKEKVPKFWVTAESFNISSFWLVWLYGLPVILILVILWLMAKWIFAIFCKLDEPEEEC